MPASAAPEGSAVTVSAAATDPAGANDPLTYTWTVLKNGAAYASPARAPPYTFTPDDDGTLTPSRW